LNKLSGLDLDLSRPHVAHWLYIAYAYDSVMCSIPCYFIGKIHNFLSHVG